MQNSGLLRKPPFFGGNFVCPLSNFCPRVGPLWTTNYFGGSWKVTLLFQVLATTILHNQTFYDSRGIAIISIFQCFRVVAAIWKRCARFVTYFYPWDHHSLRVFVTSQVKIISDASLNPSNVIIVDDMCLFPAHRGRRKQSEQQLSKCSGFRKGKMILRSSIHGFHNGSPFFLCLRGLQVWYLRQPGQSSWGCSHLCARGRVKRKMSKMKRRTTVTLFAMFTLFYIVLHGGNIGKLLKLLICIKLLSFVVVWGQTFCGWHSWLLFQGLGHIKGGHFPFSVFDFCYRNRMSEKSFATQLVALGL